MTATQSPLAILRAKASAFLALFRATPLVYQRNLSIAVLAIGLAANMLIASWLEEARLAQGVAQESLDKISEAHALMGEALIYSDRLQEDSDLVRWQDFVQDILQQSGAKLSTFTPGSTLSSGNFQVLDIDVRASGSYRQLVGFIRRLEGSEHLVRIDGFSLGIEEETLLLDCKIRILAGTSNLELLTEEGMEGEEAAP